MELIKIEEAIVLLDSLQALCGKTSKAAELINEAKALLTSQQAEVDRLNSCIKYEQSREGRIGTHGPDCYKWGQNHYECAMQEIEGLRLCGICNNLRANIFTGATYCKLLRDKIFNGDEAIDTEYVKTTDKCSKWERMG